LAQIEEMNNVMQEKLEKLTRITEGPYKAFLYDCDGTLADNMPAHKAAYVKVASQYGITLDDAIIDELAGWPTVLVAGEISKRYGVDFDPAVFADQKSSVFETEFLPNTVPIDFVVAHLKQHVEKVKIGVVSGGRRRMVTQTLAIIGVDPYIQSLVCAGETEKGKPWPDPFLKAAGELGVAPHECFVFEDGNPGIEAAEKAGMKWVRIDKI
jgi:HAD superfamily hydrolase (TIGR01509 family)